MPFEKPSATGVGKEDVKSLVSSRGLFKAHSSGSGMLKQTLGPGTSASLRRLWPLLPAEPILAAPGRAQSSGKQPTPRACSLLSRSKEIEHRVLRITIGRLRADLKWPS